MDTVAIPLSKEKALVFALVPVALLTVGAYLVSVSGAQPMVKALLGYAFGFASVAIGVLLLVGSLRMLLQRGPGMILTSEGLIENASPFGGIGFVPWADITSIKLDTVTSPMLKIPVHVLSIHVRDPRRYTEHGGWIARAIRRSNYKFFGTPIRLASFFLKGGMGQVSAALSQRGISSAA